METKQASSRRRSKLTESDIKRIRTEPYEPAPALAAELGVSTTTIYDTRNGKLHRDGAPKPTPRAQGRPRTKFPRPCECGCGGMTSPGARFVAGHQATGNDSWKTNEGFLRAMRHRNGTPLGLLRRTFANCREVDRGSELGPCWMWQGPTQNGYAQLSIEGTQSTTTRHRAVYFTLHPDADRSQDVHHLCTQGSGDIASRACMRPDHLEAISHVELLRRHRSRLTQEQVDSIRQRHPDGESLKTLADAHGYTKGSMSNIVHGHRYGPLLGKDGS